MIGSKRERERAKESRIGKYEQDRKQRHSFQSGPKKTKGIFFARRRDIYSKHTTEKVIKIRYLVTRKVIFWGNYTENYSPGLF